MTELGPEAMLVDLLGKQGTSMGRAAANVSPEAREILEGATRARKSGQNERIVGTLEDATGLPRGSRLTVDEFKNKAYNQASPEINRAYNAARAAGYDLPRTPFEAVLIAPWAVRPMNKPRNHFSTGPQSAGKMRQANLHASI